MGFDSELEDSDPDCDVEGQRIDPVRVANLKTASILGMVSNEISITSIFGHYIVHKFWYFHVQLSSIFIHWIINLNPHYFKNVC